VALSAWLAGLSDAELDLLGEALDARRIRENASSALLRSYGLPEAWAIPLGILQTRGWPVAVLGELVAVARQERARARLRRLDVVCTRPHKVQVDVLDTSVAVRRLFRQAEREVVVAGFRVNDREMLEPLRRNAGSPLDVRLFVDIDPAYSAAGAKQAMPSSLETWPSTWWTQFLEGVWPQYLDPPRAWYAPATLGPSAAGEWQSMHIKSIVVDRRLWFVTSANFTKRGHTRNMEMGALIEDPERASEVVAVFEEWAGAGVFRRVG
jgi:phosphatidylserine/phosphatidylglycerophosphate/cardiolipin synthase-like enzyme